MKKTAFKKISLKKILTQSKFRRKTTQFMQ